MKNRFIAILLAGLMVATVTACGGSSSSSSTTESASTESASTDTAASAAATESADYPVNPITCIIPYSPGGGSDILTRKIMEYLELPNGQNLVALNIDGASGFTGAMSAYNAKNDGYTILAHNHMDVIGYTLSGQTDAVLYKELTNICGIVDDFNVLVTNPQTGWTTYQEAVDYINAHPGEVKVANSGSINTNMADCIRTLRALGIYDKVTVVPYDGGSENKTALMGNHVQLAVNSCVDIQSAITSGDHIALLTIGDRRAKFLPDVPCTGEEGFDVLTTKPRGWYGPPDMDPAQVAVLQDAIKKVCENEQFVQEVLDLGLEVNYVDGAEMLEKVDAWYKDIAPVFEEMQAGQ